MPYIDKDSRKNLETLVIEMQTVLHKNPLTAGELNYLISKLFKLQLNEVGESYSTYNTLTGVLECAKLELHRRYVGRYEDKALLRNGDI